MRKFVGIIGMLAVAFLFLFTVVAVQNQVAVSNQNQGVLIGNAEQTALIQSGPTIIGTDGLAVNTVNTNEKTIVAGNNTIQASFIQQSTPIAVKTNDTFNRAAIVGITVEENTNTAEENNASITQQVTEENNTTQPVEVAAIIISQTKNNGFIVMAVVFKKDRVNNNILQRQSVRNINNNCAGYQINSNVI